MKPQPIRTRRAPAAAALALALALALPLKAPASQVTSAALSADGKLLSLGLSGASEGKLENLGKKLVLKLKGAAAAPGLKAPAGAGPVGEIRFGDHAGSLWVVVDLKSRLKPSLRKTAGGFEIALGGKGNPAAAAEAKGSAESPDSKESELEALAPAATGQTARIVDVSLGDAGGESQVIISSDAPAMYKPSVSQGGKKIAVTFRNASLAWAPVELGSADDGLQSVKARQISVHGEPQVVVEVLLKDKAPYTITRDQNQVMVNLGAIRAASAPKSRGNLDMPTSVDFENADLVGVLRSLADQAGFESKLGPSILGIIEPGRTVTFNSNNRPLREVLYGILLQSTNQAKLTAPLLFKAQGGTLFFGSAQDMAFLKAGTAVTTKFYAPRYQSRANLIALVNSTAKKPDDELASMQSDPTDADKIMVSGFESDVATTMKYLRQWDVAETGEVAAGDDAPAEESGGGRKTKVFTLKYLDVSDSAMLLAGIAQVVPEEAITSKSFVYSFDPLHRRVIATGNMRYLKKIDQLLAHIDVRMPQVHIEGKIVEVDSEDSKQLGINWSYNQQQGGQTIGAGFSASQGPTAFASYNSTIGLTTILSKIDALATEKRANVVSSPSVTVKDGIEATMEAHDTLQNTTSETTFPAQGPPVVTTKPNPQDIPISLKVTPKISVDEGKVEMKIIFVLETVTGVAPSGGAAPTTKQTVETVVLVSSAETAVIGGLTKDSLTRDTSKVPVMGDIPLLGLLFRSEKVTKKKTDIIVFITPSIVED